MSQNLVVVGAQWGDEGKGKIVDLLCSGFDIVARYQGGHNAGHTVFLDDRRFILHLIPAGILQQGKICVIGNGVVVDPTAFLAELEALRNHEVDVRPQRIRISNRAHLILPFHLALEAVSERSRGDRKVGTTMRGIGPAYEAKVGRYGIRVGDLLQPQFLHDRIKHNVMIANTVLAAYGEAGCSADELFDQVTGLASRLAPYIDDTASFLIESIQAGRRVLFEGAQGTLLDLDHGTYPFVTSSSAVAAGASTGTGVPPSLLGEAVGVLKAYTTRVGEGPFPTELLDSTGRMLRETGSEYGASTGRPRRCGWFDAIALRYAVAINGFRSLALMKLDVLDPLEEIKICIAYRVRGQEITRFPYEAHELQNCEPVYESVPGWQSVTAGISRYADLPARAIQYIDRLSELIGCEISLISTGPERRQFVLRPGTELAKYLT